MKKYTPSSKAGIPRVSTSFSLSVKNEQANAGPNDRTCLQRPNLQALTGTGNILLFSRPREEGGWQPYRVDPYFAKSQDYTYIHSVASLIH